MEDLVCTYGDWLIYGSSAPVPGVNYEFHHKDYDGAEDANDSRCGFSRTIDEAYAEIDGHAEMAEAA